MKRNFNSRVPNRGFSPTNVFFDTLFGLFPFLFVLFLASVFVTGYYKVGTLQRALNSECGTNYSWMEVASAGDDLQKLCQIKKQEITIRNR